MRARASMGRVDREMSVKKRAVKGCESERGKLVEEGRSVRYRVRK